MLKWKFCFGILARVHFPCWMKCSCHVLCAVLPLEHVGMQMPMSKNAKKMLYWRHICWNAVAMFSEMHLPFFFKCNWHVYSAVDAMFNKNAVAMFYAMCFHWGMLVWKWRYPVENVLQLPCLLYCNCHVCCNAFAMCSVLHLPCST